jgi:hypothetical protein
MLEDMERHGVIEKSGSPWSSARRPRQEKQRSLKLLRGLGENERCQKKECFTLPLNDDTLDKLAGAKLFPTPHLKSGYWQIDLHPDNKKRLLFRRFKGYGSSQLWPLDFAKLQRNLNS